MNYLENSKYCKFVCWLDSNELHEVYIDLSKVHRIEQHSLNGELKSCTVFDDIGKIGFFDSYAKKFLEAYGSYLKVAESVE